MFMKVQWYTPTQSSGELPPWAYLLYIFIWLLCFSASHKDSSFDVAISGVLFPSVLVHSIELLSEVARILKPNGKLIIREPSGIQ